MTRCKLGDHISIKHGFAFDGEYFTDEDNGIVLVTPGNFAIGGGYQEGKGKYFTGEYPAEFVLQPDDLIVTMTDLSKRIDTLGYGALVPDDGRVYLHNQRIGLVQFIDDEVDKHYLSFLMRSYDYQRAIAGSSSGSTVHHSSPVKICAYEFDLPNMEAQRRIASILMVYDNLIENNRRQIALLEEAAQRLYKEWFVDLRFPGHEGTGISEGLPNGWTEATLRDIADVVMGQSPKSEYYNDAGEGLPFHQGVSSYGLRFVRDETYTTSVTRIGRAGSILFSVRAPVGRLNYTKNEIVLGRGLAALNHKQGLQSYLYYMLKERFFKEDMIGNGSIFASISKGDLLAQMFAIPDGALAERFNTLCQPIDKQIERCDDTIKAATEARDRLLPKLMSGEIEVEG